MGPNGVGKSTLSKVIMGHPDYEILEGNIYYNDVLLNDLSTDKRANLGLFLGMQMPLEIDGVTNADMLRNKNISQSGDAPAFDVNGEEIPQVQGDPNAAPMDQQVDPNAVPPEQQEEQAAEQTPEQPVQQQQLAAPADQSAPEGVPAEELSDDTVLNLLLKGLR